MNSPTAFQESIAMRGDLTIVVRDGRTKVALQRIEIRNKIMFLAGGVVVDLLAQRAADAAPAANQIFSMRMGTSNTAASGGDTNLGAMVVGKALSDADKVSGALGNSKFVATLETTEGNGATLREAGLFTQGSATTAQRRATHRVKIRPALGCLLGKLARHSKDFRDTLQYNWRIAFTA